MSQSANPTHQPRSTLDAESVRAAYRRWAKFYDVGFGWISAAARRHAIELVNSLPGARVLEAGVGTGLALPYYDRAKRVTGIDLSAEMLAHARERVGRQALVHVTALLEMDVEATSFPDSSFDIAVGMFLASVVPHPRQFLIEMQRVVKPSGHILLINHFEALGGPRLWFERALAPASRALGWHPDFAMSMLLTKKEQADAALIKPMPPAGLFTLVHLVNRT